MPLAKPWRHGRVNDAGRRVETAMLGLQLRACKIGRSAHRHTGASTSTSGAHIEDPFALRRSWPHDTTGKQPCETGLAWLKANTLSAPAAHSQPLPRGPNAWKKQNRIDRHVDCDNISAVNGIAQGLHTAGRGGPSGQSPRRCAEVPYSLCHVPSDRSGHCCRSATRWMMPAINSILSAGNTGSGRK